nr:MAG TPA: hypothetical protein [Caudoviricetes sp.]
MTSMTHNVNLRGSGMILEEMMMCLRDKMTFTKIGVKT